MFPSSNSHSLILCRSLFEVGDDDHLDGGFTSFQAQAVLLDGVEYGRSGVDDAARRGRNGERAVIDLRGEEQPEIV